jgi:hypothetical protein
MNGVETHYSDPILPGDRISASIVAFPGDSAAAITDFSKWSHSTGGAGATSIQYASGIIARGCTSAGCVPVPQFTTLRSSGDFGGGPISPNAKPTKIKSATGAVEARGKPGAAGKNKFVVNWVSTCGPVDGNGLC